MLQRQISQLIERYLQPQRVLVVFGPRRVGKTTVMQEFLSQNTGLYLDGEDDDIQSVFSSNRLQILKNFIGNSRLLVIDEAQNIPNIGKNLKLLVDHISDIQIVCSGSSSFMLAKQVGEPLTGRKKTLFLYPLSLREKLQYEGEIYAKSVMQDMLVFGGYPKLTDLNQFEKKDYLREIVSSYLLRDILQLEHVVHPKKINQLLQLLAFQIGKQVSLTELGNQLGIHKDTVNRYLTLLEESFIIVNIRGLSRNLRREITKTSRYYFYDNGIRNAIINNFNNLDSRDDIGMLWENFIIIERLKKQIYQEISSNNYFWRTYSQEEIDFVEERDGRYFGFEMKWKQKRTKVPASWKEYYPHSSFQVIHQENYLDFI